MTRLAGRRRQSGARRKIFRAWTAFASVSVQDSKSGKPSGRELRPAAMATPNSCWGTCSGEGTRAAEGTNSHYVVAIYTFFHFLSVQQQPHYYYLII